MMTEMTLQEAKEHTAKLYGFDNWDCIDFYMLDSQDQTAERPYAEERLNDEVAELYAHGKLRDFKLLVREYFQIRSDINNIDPPSEWARYTRLCDELKNREKRILSELERFTEQEQKELPFK